ncbi:MAG: MFS transporter [Firmicutes bacterium]|nr:MFS transporter [Bacillota bacterium]
MKNKSLFRNSNFMLLWIGQSVSQLGTRLYSLAIMWYILERTGSSVAMGISVLCFTLPTVIIGPVAGVFADKYSKKKIIVVTDLLNGVIMLTLSYMVFRNNISLNVLYSMMALAACVSAVFSPAISSSYPLIVDEKNLTKANSLSQFTSRIISILGPAVAGILIAILNMWVLFFLNGISYIISSISESFITIPKINEKKHMINQKFILRFKEGLGSVWSNKSVLYLVISGGIIINFFLAPLSVYFAIISENLGKGSTGLGTIEASLSIGALIGSLIILTGIVKNKYRMTIFGLTLEGVALVVFGGFVESYYLILLSQAALGFGVAFASVGISTLYQTLIPKEKMGRVMSIVGTLCSISVPLGALFGSWAISYYSIQSVLIISGVIVSFSGISLISILRIAKKEKTQLKLV